MRLRNKNAEERQFALSVKSHPILRIQLEGMPYALVAVPADTALPQRVYVVSPPGSAPSLSERTDFRLWEIGRAHV